MTERNPPQALLVSTVGIRRDTVLHVSEHAGRYLHLPKGPIPGSLMTRARPELQLELRAARFPAFERNKATVSRPGIVRLKGRRAGQALGKTGTRIFPGRRSQQHLGANRGGDNAPQPD